MLHVYSCLLRLPEKDSCMGLIYGPRDSSIHKLIYLIIEVDHCSPDASTTWKIFKIVLVHLYFLSSGWLPNYKLKQVFYLVDISTKIINTVGWSIKCKFRTSWHVMAVIVLMQLSYVNCWTINNAFWVSCGENFIQEDFNVCFLVYSYPQFRLSYAAYLGLEKFIRFWVSVFAITMKHRYFCR